MKSSRPTAAIATSVTVVAVGAGTAAATGVLSSRQRWGQPSRSSRARPRIETPKNVIFLLGDGMGTQEITAARYYQGVQSPLNVDRMPFTGFDTTWSVKPAAAPPYQPDYDPDSASTGTLWATGKKTIDERISQGPSSAIDVPGENLDDRARARPGPRDARPAMCRPPRSPTRRRRYLPRTSRYGAARARRTWAPARTRPRAPAD